MPYRNEFARGDSLSRLADSPSVKEFQGAIRHRKETVFYEPPSSLEPPRGVNRIERVIAIDGSTVTHRVENGYPGAEAAILNLAAIVIKLEAIREIRRDYIPSPREMRDMEQCETLSAVFPGRNVVSRDRPEDSPKQFFRETLCKELEARLDPDHESLLETLRNITKGRESKVSCPIDECPRGEFGEWVEPKPGLVVCNCDLEEVIYETDSLRTHERFEEFGSSAQAYTAVRQVVEHLTLVIVLRYFERTESLGVFRNTAFIMDGPLAVFGMPAWLKEYIEREVARLHNKALEQGDPGILLLGIEKSGQFLDHLRELDWMEGEGPRHRLPNGTALVPDIEYIHTHIVLRPLNVEPYGKDTYYGRKVMYKNRAGQHSVIMTPIVNASGSDPHCVDETAFPRLGEALDIMDELSTHLYQDGFAPLVRAHAHAAIPLRTGAGILESLFSED